MLFIIGISMLWAMMLVGMTGTSTAVFLMLVGFFIGLALDGHYRVALLSVSFISMLYLVGYTVPPVNLFSSWRSYMCSEMLSYMDSDYAYILIAMLVGDKSQLPREIYSAFQGAGIVHLLSVSGFHTSLWSMVVYRFFMSLGLGRRWSSVISILFILGFMCLTGLAFSTVRAGLMFIVFFIGRAVSRTPNSLNSLGLAAIVILVLSPSAGSDTGFLLSFFSTLGILVCFPRMSDWLSSYLSVFALSYPVKSFIRSVVSILFLQISTFVFTLPFVMLFIGETSLVAPLGNLLVSTIMSLAIFLSGVGIMLSVVPVLRVVTPMLLLISGLIVKAVIWVSQLLSSLPFAMMDIGSGYVKIGIACAIVLCGFSVILRGSVKRTVLLSMILCFSSIVAHYIVEYVAFINYL